MWSTKFSAKKQNVGFFPDKVLLAGFGLGVGVRVTVKVIGSKVLFWAVLISSV